MRMVDLIAKKRDGGNLSKAEIDWMIASYVKEEIPDYQMSAFLMAVYFKGMADDEMANFAGAMLHSGEVLDLSSIPGVKIDKHSTGGVGDKISLILAPVLAALGVNIPMISGRGLGFTGGTLDKLEAIPGFNVNLTVDQFRKQVTEHHEAIISASKEVAPADRRLYALRDVTATVESIPLIAGSIMSKKISSGIDALVLDVKVGRGAFMKTQEDAEKLAKALVTIGKAHNVKTKAVLSDMNQPLGLTIGNALEVAETIATLNGRGPKDVRQLTITLAAEMLVLAGKTDSTETAASLAGDVLRDGRALRAFRQMVIDQGGDVRVIDNPQLLPRADFRTAVKAPRSGFINNIDSEALGLAAMQLGAGRAKTGDKLDPAVGLVLHKKVGTPVSEGDTLATVHSNQEQIPAVLAAVQAAFDITDAAPAPSQLIRGFVE
ncbi:thymidine phosphorylase [Lacticaseibacillus pabuli]|uniref:Pyrimidine-nucleoside phosphorylase n=1 Tax=Lacticaseibacillus pabuli TaxID=3025672 RepID=A0ABY7WYY8_9LACO|nr:thymidine phosphorylase [Lacticaseibacillus sp. KACC 23028]WDF83125.1 thymidine phosphorylase [Lacticaseibacillus sp. KACC 23028]